MAMRGSAWLFLFWLALATSSLVHELTGDEGAASLSQDPDTEENKQESIAQDEISALVKAVKVNLPEKLPDVPQDVGGRTWSQEAQTLVEAVEKLHRELTERNLKLRVKQLSPKKAEDAAPYGKVKGLLIKENNKPFKRVPNAESCELKCSLDITCMAFSYNTDARECLISSVAMGYDPDVIFYAKKGANGGYSMFPGMTETSEMRKPSVGKSKSSCELDCSGNMNCKGYSFRKSNSACTLTDEPLHYDAEWDYYEKPHRSSKNGDAFDIRTHKETDALGITFRKFWADHEFNSKLTSKAKVLSFEAKMTAIKDKTIQSEDQIRMFKATLAGQNNAAEKLTRSVKSADFAVKQQGDGLVEAQGRVERSQLSLKLEQDTVLKRQALLEKRQPKPCANCYAPAKSIKEVLNEDITLNEAKDKVISARQQLTNDEMNIERRTKELRDTKMSAVELTRKYILTLTSAKATEEDVKSAKLGLASLALEAKELTRLVDQEALNVVPPAAAVEPPSMEHLLGWITKNTKAEQNAKALEIEWMMSQGQGPPAITNGDDK